MNVQHSPPALRRETARTTVMHSATLTGTMSRSPGVPAFGVFLCLLICVFVTALGSSFNFLHPGVTTSSAVFDDLLQPPNSVRGATALQLTGAPAICLHASEVYADFQCALPQGSPLYKQIPKSAAPSVAIIGTAKGGTTDVYTLLLKVLHFRKPIRKEHGDLMHESTIGWNKEFRKYMIRLGHPCARASITQGDFKLCMNNLNAPALTMDASPMYLEDLQAPITLKSISPGTKVIILLREPLERAVSLYNHWQKKTNTFGNKSLETCAQQFLEWTQLPAVSAITDKLLAATDLHTMQTHYKEIVAQGLLKRMRYALFVGGFYVYGLSNWLLSFLTPGNVLIMDSHVYYASSRNASLNHIARFIKHRNATEFELRHASKVLVQNSKLRVGKQAVGTNLSDTTKRQLQAYFEPHTRKLLTLLDCMRQAGYDIVGFKGAPWTNNSGSIDHLYRAMATPEPHQLPFVQPRPLNSRKEAFFRAIMLNNASTGNV
jgi:hypothetical protein